MDNIKAIVLDIDGVIVGEKIGFNSPDPHNDVIAKMRQLRDSGIKIILCTAKPHFAIRSIIQSANLDNPHITDGGGVLISPINNDIIKQYVIEKEQAKRVIEMCLRNGIYVEVYTTEKYIVQKSQVNKITPQHTHILQCEPEIVDDLLSLDEQITKIMPVVNGESEKAKFTKLFNELNSNLALAWGIHPVALPLLFGIITAKGITKKQGALDILESLNISTDNALGVGDSTSDWAFIEPLKYGGAMDNASQELKDKVLSKGTNGIIGGHVDENGINAIFDTIIRQPTQEIVKFVAEHILTEYAKKLPYKLEHINYVMRRSILFANQIKDQQINIDMAYLIGAYHDIGEPVDRKTHELIGAEMLRKDKRLQTFFTSEQIEIMAQAVEDHRASGKTEPRTIYGKIVSSADRTTDLDDMLRLTYGFRKRQGMTDLDQIIEDGYQHLCDKFGECGYAMSKMFFNDPEFDKFKIETVALTKDKAKYIERFLIANGIKGGK